MKEIERRIAALEAQTAAVGSLLVVVIQDEFRGETEAQAIERAEHESARRIGSHDDVLIIRAVSPADAKL